MFNFFSYLYIILSIFYIDFLLFVLYYYIQKRAVWFKSRKWGKEKSDSPLQHLIRRVLHPERLSESSCQQKGWDQGMAWAGSKNERCSWKKLLAKVNEFLETGWNQDYRRGTVALSVAVLLLFLRLRAMRALATSSIWPSLPLSHPHHCRPPRLV